MELIVKVNVKAIESGKNKFNVYNTYIKDEQSGEWVKFNVKFKQGEQRPDCNSYVYADENEISINELGKYPTIFINKVNKIVKLRFDGADLKKFFRAVDEKQDNIDTDDVFNDEPISELTEQLFGEPVENPPFDTEKKTGKK